MRYRVDMPAPGRGLGRRLNDMLDWCHVHAGLGNYDQHGYLAARPDGRDVQAFIRFSFESARDAARFRQEFGSVTTPRA